MIAALGNMTKSSSLPGTVGLGKETIVTLAQHIPSHIYFTGRNKKSASKLVNTLEKLGVSSKMPFFEYDSASLEGVETTAKEFWSVSERLDILL